MIYLCLALYICGLWFAHQYFNAPTFVDWLCIIGFPVWCFLCFCVLLWCLLVALLPVVRYRSAWVRSMGEHKFWGWTFHSGLKFGVWRIIKLGAECEKGCHCFSGLAKGDFILGFLETKETK